MSITTPSSEHPGSTSKQCPAIRRDGQPCQASAGASGYCVGHRPGALLAVLSGQDVVPETIRRAKRRRGQHPVRHCHPPGSDQNGGGIVGDQRGPVLVGLREQAVDCLLQPDRAVVAGDADRDGLVRPRGG